MMLISGAISRNISSFGPFGRHCPGLKQLKNKERNSIVDKIGNLIKESEGT
jgi:hypothetical protein